jgi:hypothetical protein
VLAVIAATAGRDCGSCIETRKNRKYNRQPSCAPFAIPSTRDGRTGAAPAMAPSFFRFPSVASRPRFSHDPANLAPDCDG